MRISPSIFRLYDIRGVAGKEFPPRAIAEYERWYGKFPGITITPEAAEAIGRAYGTFMVRQYGAKEILVGHEERPFAVDLSNAFINGIRLSGCNVTDAGVALTPLIYFSNCYSHFDGAVNITGSHNVYFFNGFKMMAKQADPVFGDDLQVLRKMIEREDYLEAPMGELKSREFYPEYQKYVADRIKLSRPMRIVIDTGNGSAGLFARKFFTAVGCEVVDVLYESVDATFPNHVPDPEDSYSLIELGKRVVSEKADLGIGLDADGDRVGFVDERGRYIDTDLPLLLMAKDILSRRPGGKILFDAKCSRLLPDLIPTYGGVPLMHMTGHAPIKKTMRHDQSIVLGGEVSGHMFFVEDYFRIDDGLYAAARVIEHASKSRQPFSSLFSDIPQTVRTPEMKLPCDDEKKFEVVRSVRDVFAEGHAINEIDGVRVNFDAHSWALVRASNTSPYLTVRMEADTEERLLEIKNTIADELEKYPEIGDRLNRKAVTSRTGRLGWV